MHDINDDYHIYLNILFCVHVRNMFLPQYLSMSVIKECFYKESTIVMNVIYIIGKKSLKRSKI